MCKNHLVTLERRDKVVRKENKKKGRAEPLEEWEFIKKDKVVVSLLDEKGKRKFGTKR